MLIVFVAYSKCSVFRNDIENKHVQGVKRTGGWKREDCVGGTFLLEWICHGLL